MLETLRTYFMTCSALSNMKKFGIDFMGEEPPYFTITKEPTDPIVEKYADGGVKKRLSIVLDTKEFYSEDLTQNTGNNTFLETLEKWIETQDTEKNFPVIGDGVTKMEITGAGALFSVDDSADRAIYRIQVEIEYYKKGGI